MAQKPQRISLDSRKPKQAQTAAQRRANIIESMQRSGSVRMVAEMVVRHGAMEIETDTHLVTMTAVPK